MVSENCHYIHQCLVRLKRKEIVADVPLMTQCLLRKMETIDNRFQLVPRIDRLLGFIECGRNDLGYGVFWMHSGSLQCVGDKLGLVHILCLATHDHAGGLKSSPPCSRPCVPDTVPERGRNHRHHQPSRELGDPLWHPARPIHPRWLSHPGKP